MHPIIDMESVATKESIILLLVALWSSAVLAYFALKVNLSFRMRLIINFSALFLWGVLVLLTGAKTFCVVLYLLLLFLTLLGIGMRFIVVLLFNIIDRLLAKRTLRKHSFVRYDEIKERDQNGIGNSAYFFVQLFTTLKMLLYIILILTL